MKIIAVDNFDRETRDDVLVCENVNEYYAERIVNFLNIKYSGEHESRYFKAVKDDFKLYKYEWWTVDLNSEGGNYIEKESVER